MNTYQITKTNINTGEIEYVSGALTYQEAIRKVKELNRNDMENLYDFEIFMPNR